MTVIPGGSVRTLLRIPAIISLITVIPVKFPFLNSTGKFALHRE